LGVFAVAASGCLFGCGTSALRIDPPDSTNAQSGVTDPRNVNDPRRSAGASTPVAAPSVPGAGGANARDAGAGASSTGRAVPGSAGDAGVGVGPTAGMSARPVDAGPAFPDGGVPVFDAGSAGAPALAGCVNGTWFGDVIIRAAADSLQLKGCRTIDGNMTIGANYVDNLVGLEELDTIRGTLTITPEPFQPWSGPAPSAPVRLKSLAGLDRLRSVSRLELTGLPLATLKELSALQMANEISLAGLDQLQDLRGLESVAWTVLTIRQNASLRSLDGLRTPAETREVMIMTNPKLEDLGPLTQLKYVINLSLSALPALKTLEPLAGLRVIGVLSIDNCNGLHDLTGLAGLETLRTTLTVSQNQQLRTLNGLAVRDGVPDATLSDNPLLESIPGLGASDGTFGNVELTNLPALKTLADLKGLVHGGRLTIRGCDGLSDLSGLSQLQTIDYLELADCLGLQSFNGVDALESISDGLLIGGLPKLSSAQGFKKLTRAAAMSIGQANALQSLVGFESLTSVDALSVENNAQLQNLHGLENVSTIQSVDLQNNSSLKSLEGLSAVVELQSLSVFGNVMLTSLQGLNALSTVEQMMLSSNSALTALTGLEHLITVGSVMSIQGNSQLASLRALAALTSVGSLDISDNRRLPQCEIEWLAKQTNSFAPPLGNNGPAGMCTP
jgi:hypothetical protein